MQISKELYSNFEKLGIAVLYLFGSRAQGLATAHSDYDFGILLENPSVIKDESMNLYQKIYELLQEEVKDKVNMDIVFLDRSPMQLRYHVIRYGQVLYDGNPMKRGRFMEQTLEEHADFEPYRPLFEKSILAQIP